MHKTKSYQISFVDPKEGELIKYFWSWQHAHLLECHSFFLRNVSFDQQKGVCSCAWPFRWSDYRTKSSDLKWSYLLIAEQLLVQYSEEYGFRPLDIQILIVDCYYTDKFPTKLSQLSVWNCQKLKKAFCLVT